MAINRRTCRLFHFDRKGVAHTPPIDFHKHAEVFVRLLLGISSLDEETLGLDTAVQWEIDADGRKTTGTITVAVDANDSSRDEVYAMHKPAPEIRAFTICGSGSTTWRALKTPIVEGEEPTEVMIKFSWRAGDRAAEYIFLSRLAVNIQGIAQLISRREKDFSTRIMRDSGDDAQGLPWFGSCLVLEAHGPPIIYFTSERQFWGAMRDVISSKSFSERSFTRRRY